MGTPYYPLTHQINHRPEHQSVGNAIISTTVDYKAPQRKFSRRFCTSSSKITGSFDALVLYPIMMLLLSLGG